MSASCVLTDCMDYYGLYNNCLIQYPSSAIQQEKCICTSTAIAYYTKCYPCVTSLPTTTGPIMSVANYTATCNALSSSPGTGYTFSGFTGLPTSTGGYFPIPSGTGGSGSGSNNSNSGSSDKGSSSNTGLYAGIGAGVGVVVLGAALFFWHRSRKNKKHTKVPPPPAMQAVHNHQPPPHSQPSHPAVPLQHQYSQPSAQAGYQQQHPDQQNHFQQQQNPYQQQYSDQQQQQQNHYQPQTVVPQQQQQQQYTSQPPVVTNFYGQAGGGSYPDPNAYDPNQQHQGYYPTASTAAPLPQPVPSPTFPPNEYYQQQQQQQQQQAQHTFSPVVTTSGIHQQQEPMPMPEQSNPYGLTSPSATTNTTAYSPAMTTSNSTSYETPATTAFAYEAPASIVPPVAGTAGVNKVSTHGPQVIPGQEQQHPAANYPKNPQYVEPHYNNNAYHN
ncbi:hypothetical protein K457DRAFT_17624 [Linnemannia elongata AG-77]|uniref:Extracellular membrane protein CFEM domain-containing protein n=1 Tax=Linnemannia elongata AG-77 TaxID=1314771 RepID=A0A197K368_9FUNG|nr:hypothetical protein K457DRAFT_17624 [Linnemannia elongata AG-77]